MKKIILSFFILLGLSTHLSASSKVDSKIKQTNKPISYKKIKNMDRSHTKRKARRRNFQTQKQFQNHLKRQHTQRRMQTNINVNKRYTNGNRYRTNTHMYDDYYPNSQYGYARPNRGWQLAYRYDRAGFYDQEGYYYGYFNRYGYYFEDVFYRYDRYYSYKDRLNGRGLFNHRFYMPENAEYYGFCSQEHRQITYTRAY